jgi:hypothetical protein
MYHRALLQDTSTLTTGQRYMILVYQLDTMIVPCSYCLDKRLLTPVLLQRIEQSDRASSFCQKAGLAAGPKVDEDVHYRCLSKKWVQSKGVSVDMKWRSAPLLPSPSFLSSFFPLLLRALKISRNFYRALSFIAHSGAHAGMPSTKPSSQHYRYI